MIATYNHNEQPIHTFQTTNVLNLTASKTTMLKYTIQNIMRENK